MQNSVIQGDRNNRGIILDGIAAAKAFSKLYEDFWKKEVCITCDDEILTKEEKCEA